MPSDATLVVRETRTERVERLMFELTRCVPSTKGMGPKDRADRLHAELVRRIALAKSALQCDSEAEVTLSST